MEGRWISEDSVKASRLVVSFRIPSLFWEWDSVISLEFYSKCRVLGLQTNASKNICVTVEKVTSGGL